MTRKTGQVFVEKRTYRQRRLADAARLLPILGAGLFALPLLWKGDGSETGMRTVSVMLYLFLAWIFLFGASAIISRRLSLAEEDRPRETEG